MFTLYILLIIGFLIRLFLIGNTGFLADISFWKSWSLAAIDNGLVWTTFNTNINYPPGFIYVLWVMGKLYSLLGDPHDYYTFWRENNFAFLFVSKSVAIFSDVVITCLIYWFFSQKEKLRQLGIKNPDYQRTLFNVQFSLPVILSAVFFLNPVVILDSALWGQVESFGIMFTLAALILIFYQKPLLATALFTVGTLMKLQNIIYIPIYFIFLWRYFDLKTAIKSFSVSALVFFLVNLPFVLSNNMDKVLALLTVNSDYFPWMSLNAHNLWWIVSQAKGLHITDKITVLGLLNAKTLGLLIFASFYFLSCLVVYKKTSARNLMLSLTLGIFAFFLFTTQSHERYSYPVVVFLIFLFPFLNLKSLDLPTRSIRLYQYLKVFIASRAFFWAIYAFLTVLIFFNIHYSLVYNYPQNGIGFLTKISTAELTILSAVLHIFLYFVLFIYLRREIHPLALLAPFVFILSGIIYLQAPYIFQSKVKLTFFKPVIIKQDFSIPQLNKSVNSYSGWKSWNRLSNNYFFYRSGIGSHANSNLVYDVNRKFSSFSTDFAVDTEADVQASVVFKIFGDDKELFTSGKMGKFDYPKHARVSIKGVKRLSLAIEDGGDGINNDHADWLNPVLYR